MTYRIVFVCLMFTVFCGCSNDSEDPTPPAADSDDVSSTDPQSNTGVDSGEIPEPADGESFTPTHTILVPTEYYTGGPQQGRPPDGTFESGTKVSLIEEAGSYSLIESESGTQAYVATDALSVIE